MEIQCRNVNDAFRRLVAGFVGRSQPSVSDSWSHLIRERESRNGKVRVIDEPVLVSYSHPRERVLFNAARDCNPFFHVYEALWMLAGRNDVASVAYYAKQMKEYSDNGKTLNGAYGYRWRHAHPVYDRTKGDDWSANPDTTDQLNLLVQHLNADPNSRRAVLQMWNVEDDLLKIGCLCCDTRARTLFFVDPGPCPHCGTKYRERQPASKDVCCNLSVMFSLREEIRGYTGWTPPSAAVPTLCLDMTVTNRSNDLVWGILGANYVHFTFLQEYMAARLGAEVGRYHHFTNNLHAYVERPDWKPEAWLDYYDGVEHDYTRPYANYDTVPLVSDPVAFDRELPAFVDTYSGDTDKALRFEERFLETVAKPMMTAHRYYKRGHYDAALGFAEQVNADDWRIAATEWLKRRAK